MTITGDPLARRWQRATSGKRVQEVVDQATRLLLIHPEAQLLADPRIDGYIAYDFKDGEVVPLGAVGPELQSEREVRDTLKALLDRGLPVIET